MASVALQFNTLTTRRTRYIPTQQDLEEALKEEYGGGIDFKVEVCLARPLRYQRGVIKQLDRTERYLAFQ